MRCIHPGSNGWSTRGTVIWAPSATVPSESGAALEQRPCSSRLPPASDWEWRGCSGLASSATWTSSMGSCGARVPVGLAKTFYKLLDAWSSSYSFLLPFPILSQMLVQQCDLKFSRHLVHLKDPWYLVILGAVQTFIRHVVHTKRSWYLVLSIWHMNQIWSDQISRVFFMWTTCLMDILDRTECSARDLKALLVCSHSFSPFVFHRPYFPPHHPLNKLFMSQFTLFKSPTWKFQILWCSILSVSVQYPQWFLSQ